MLRVKNLFNVFTLSAVMFGAGATVATVALSYLPMVNASSTKITQGLKQSKAEEVDEDNGLKFKFQDCKRGGKYVVCSVLATNLKNDNQKVYFQADSDTRGRVIDVDGNQYVGKLVIKGQPKDDGWLATSLIQGIPTKISYSFEIPQEVTRMAALEVKYTISDNTTSNKYGKVAIRDINISSSQASNPGNPENCNCPPQTNSKKPRPR